MNKVKKSVFCLLGITVCTNGHVMSAANPDPVGIFATVFGCQGKISRAVDTRDATVMMKQKSGNGNPIYWLNRKPCDTYHITLDMLEPANGTPFSNNDIDQIAGVLENYKSRAEGLKDKKGQPKSYEVKGYELRLFVHFTDKSVVQYNAKDIDSLSAQPKAVAYANLVLKIGTGGALKKDWEHVRQNIFTKQNHSRVFKSKASHELETHITIADLYNDPQNSDQLLR